MQFSDASNNTGIIQEAERLTDLGYTTVSGDTTKLKEFTVLANNNGHKVWHTIFMSNGNWSYDDGNQTDLPQATTNITSGTAKYSIPSTALTVQRVEFLDVYGLWYSLTPITKEMLVSEAVDEFMKTNGQPKYYRLIGNTIELFPAPDYTQDSSLKVYFDRASSDFATSDTTKTPGFASPYHQIIPLGMAIDWLKVKQPNSPTLAVYIQDYLKLEDNIKKYYNKRWKDIKPTISRARQTFK